MPDIADILRVRDSFKARATRADHVGATDTSPKLRNAVVFRSRDDKSVNLFFSTICCAPHRLNRTFFFPNWKRVYINFATDNRAISLEFTNLSTKWLLKLILLIKLQRVKKNKEIRQLNAFASVPKLWIVFLMFLQQYESKQCTECSFIILTTHFEEKKTGKFRTCFWIKRIQISFKTVQCF